jgi:hypothetical protein
MGLDVAGIGAVADLASSLINRFFPDKTEQEKAQLAAALQIIQGQLDANKTEAANPSVFVSGWRPFIGWICGSACAWNWIGLKVAVFACAYFGHPVDLSPADLGEMMPVLMGMLGLGGLRTLEKINGVAAK